MIRSAIAIAEKDNHKEFVMSAMAGCGMDFEFVKNDDSKGGLDTNYAYIQHGKFKLKMAVSLPNKADGINTYSTSVEYEPVDSKNPKIFYNAKNIDDALKWLQKETSITLDKKNFKG